MKAKKSLGQNFLKNPHIAQGIAKSAHLKKGEVILEIGPGKGVLTQKLLSSNTVVAVEKDKRLMSFLMETFSEEVAQNKLILVEGDALKPALYKKYLGKQFSIVANIPYYITGKFLREIFSLEHLPRKVTLMVQKEVADRIVAKDKKESMLSISVKAYATPKIVRKVSKKSFSPIPKVDSSVIIFDHISRKNFKKISEKDFFSVVRKGFAHRRKLLRSNLDIQDKVLRDCALHKNTRAENITVENWLCITKHMK